MDDPSMGPTELLFLSWGSPWPAHGGGSLRTLGLLKQLCKAHPIRLIVLAPEPLSGDQSTVLYKYTNEIVRIPMAGETLRDKLQILTSMFLTRTPYHCSLLSISAQRVPGILQELLTYPGVVYANFGHWGTLVRGHNAPNWILDQQNADVQFWRAYATQVSSPVLKLAASMNGRLAAMHFPLIYSSVGRVISVCDEDRQLTLALAPNATVDVIENGVDCSYFSPDRRKRMSSCRLLFTGTSAPRNVVALHRFAQNVLPLIHRELPTMELLVAGNFQASVQEDFKQYRNVRFTGRVQDIRPYFNQSDVFIVPFQETHGSKLKVAEAMAMSMPIVSTPQGVRGFPLVNEESVMIASNSQEFATQTLSLLRSPERRAAMGSLARQIAVSALDWSVLGKRLNRIVRKTRVKLEQDSDQI